MAPPHKILALCLCLMLASLGAVVGGKHGMMGMFGGGGGHGKHGGGGIEALLAAGILAKLLKGRGGGGGHGYGHSHGRSSYGGDMYSMMMMPYDFGGFEYGGY